jgi:Fe-S-cluster containining protein
MPKRAHDVKHRGARSARSSSPPKRSQPAQRKQAARSLPVLASERTQLPCLSCALCCSYIAIAIDEPSTLRAAGEILWYLYHDDVSVYVEDGDFMVQFETRCGHLQDDNRCGIYEHRPPLCREFEAVSCEVNAEEVGTTFYSADDFLAYLAVHHKRIHALLCKRYLPPRTAADVARDAGARLPVSALRLAALRARLPQPAAGKPTQAARSPRRPAATTDFA